MQNIEFLEELTIENLGNLGFGNELLNTKKKAKSMKEKMVSWTLIKLKTSALWRHCEENKNPHHRLGKNLCKTLV